MVEERNLEATTVTRIMHGESAVMKDSPENPWFPAMGKKFPRNHNKQQQ